jgi:hypothetical protein
MTDRPCASMPVMTRRIGFNDSLRWGAVLLENDMVVGVFVAC